MKTSFYSNEEIKEMSNQGFSEDFAEYLTETTEYIRSIVYTWGPKRAGERISRSDLQEDLDASTIVSANTGHKEYTWNGNNWVEKESPTDEHAEDTGSNGTVEIDETEKNSIAKGDYEPENKLIITPETNDIEIHIDEEDQESATLTLMSLMQVEQVISKDINNLPATDDMVKSPDNGPTNLGQQEVEKTVTIPPSHYSDIVFDGRIDVDELFFTPIPISEKKCPLDSSSLKEIQVVLHKGKRRVGRYLLSCSKCKRLYVNQDEVVELIDLLNNNEIEYTIE